MAVKQCRGCGRVYIKARWCPNCYDNSGHARAKFAPRPNTEIADIWSDGIPYFILREQVRDGVPMAQVIRADGIIIEPCKWLDTAAAIAGD